MNCENIQQLWESYLSGEVSSWQQLEIQQHITYCSECKNLKLASWLVKLKQTDNPQLHSFWSFRVQLTLAAAILLTLLITWSTIFRTQKNTPIEILHLESSTTYISEEGNTYYYYYLGNITNED